MFSAVSAAALLPLRPVFSPGSTSLPESSSPGDRSLCLSRGSGAGVRMGPGVTLWEFWDSRVRCLFSVSVDPLQARVLAPLMIGDLLLLFRIVRGL